MAFKQFFTSSRPDASIPFFEQTGDGRVRIAEQLEIANNFPDLLTREIPVMWDDDPDMLVFTATYIYSDFGAWITLKDMMTANDQTLRDDWFNYYMANGHTLLMEYQDETMDERDMLCQISPTGMIFKNFDGIIRERSPDGVTVARSPTGEIRTFNLDGTVTVELPDGTTTVYQQDTVTFPEGITPPSIRIV